MQEQEFFGFPGATRTCKAGPFQDLEGREASLSSNSPASSPRSFPDVAS